MVDVRVVLVLMQILLICNTFGLKRPHREKYLEGEACRTPILDSGKCMNYELCDPAFVHSMSYADHSLVCEQNAFYNVFCCQPFMDFCKNRINSHITYGNETEPEMFPHLARLGKNNDIGEIEWSCSANIISVNFLLTAAHCKQVAHIAGVGCTDPVLCEQQITIKNFISYDTYEKSKKYHDIALVELQNEMKFNSRVLPICPYAKMDDLPDTEDMLIAGWGHTERHARSQRLMHATVRTVPITKCREEYRDILLQFGQKLIDGILDEQYCARGSLQEIAMEHADACQGDSGGPLQAKQNNYKYLVGIISAGIGCSSSRPGLYTRVAAYFNWINATITGSAQFVVNSSMINSDN